MNAKLTAFLLAIVLTISTNVGWSGDISPQAVKNLALVHEVGSEIGHPDILQAILMQESRGGENTRSSSASYGLMQVQLVAARSVLNRVPQVLASAFPGQHLRHLSDSAIKHRLISDDKFNVTIAAHHFDIYFKLCHANLDKTIAAYNMGIGGVQRVSSPASVPYVKQVKRHLHSTVRDFNARFAQS